MKNEILTSCPFALKQINSLINLVKCQASHAIVSSMIGYSEINLEDRMKLRKKLHAIKWQKN